MVEIFNGICPNLDKEVKVIVEYIPISVSTNNTSYSKGSMDCSIGSRVGMCPHKVSCPIYKSMPESKR